MTQQEEERSQEKHKTYRQPELTDLGTLPGLTETGTGEVPEPFGGMLTRLPPP
jgi:hypothetical protein